MGFMTHILFFRRGMAIAMPEVQYAGWFSGHGEEGQKLFSSVIFLSINEIEPPLFHGTSLAL